MERSPAEDRAELQRNLIVCACCAPIALLIYLVTHAVYANLIETTQAMGSVDPTTAVGLDMGFVTMVGGTAVFAAIAAVAGVRAFQLWSRLRRSA